MNIHFIINNNLEYHEFVGIYSAYIINSPDNLYIHYIEEIENDNFNSLKLLRNVIFIKSKNNKHIIIRKLEILLKYGGIFLEKNILCFNKIEKILKDDKELIFFRDYDKNEHITNNISECIIVGKKQSIYIDKFINFFNKTKNFIIDESFYKYDSIDLMQNKNYLINTELYIDDNLCNTLLFFYKKKDYSKIIEYNSYKMIMKNLKNKMIIKTPKEDSLFYSIINIIINSDKYNKINLDSEIINVDILSIKYSNVYTKAKNNLKKQICDYITLNDKCEYTINKILDVVNKIYDIPLKIIKLNDYTNKKIKITELKNIIIQVIDNYYISIK